MQVEVTERTIKIYHFSLESDDPLLVFRNPYDIGERVLEMLAPHLPSAPAKPKRPKPKRESQITLGRNGQSQRPPVGKRAAPKAAGRGRGQSTEQIPCPECGKPIARKFLPLHRRKTHGADSTPTSSAAAAESATT